MNEIDKIRFEIWKRIDIFIESQYEKLGWDNPVVEEIGEAWSEAENLQYIFSCEKEGHIWEMDQCCKTEHQYCLLCGVRIDQKSLEDQIEKEMNESSGCDK